MAYDLQEVADYADKIANECSSVNLSLKEKWEDTARALNPHERNFRSERTKFTLKYFAVALRNASTHFINKGIDEGQQKAIDTNLIHLKDAYHLIFPQGKLKMPLPALTPTSRKTTLGLVTSWLSNSKIEPKVTEFLNSPGFKNLEDYLHQVLNEDERDHSFLCFGDFSEPKKLNVLNLFITDLKSMRTKKELTDFLEEFYSQKGQTQPFTKETGSRSRYDILNTGQNITTRFFSCFGLQTTTIDLIDSLRKSIMQKADNQESILSTFNVL
ncbi:MAG: hypothetical protein H0T84_10955 [Tatlockia sp.]|nr:hypothetical protein [Tatlockia sp.]